MNDLTITTPSRAPALQTRAYADLLARFRNAVEQTPAGHYAISDRRLPEGAEREALIGRRDELLAALRPADKAMVAARVARMFLRFPASRGADAEATVAAYATDLSRFPLWAIDKGLGGIITGRTGGGTFAPSSVECQGACERELIDIRNELADLTRILDAEVYHELTSDEREKVKAGFDELLADLRLNEPLRPGKRGPNQMTQAEAEAGLERQKGKPLPMLSDELRDRLGLTSDRVPDLPRDEEAA